MLGPYSSCARRVDAGENEVLIPRKTRVAVVISQDPNRKSGQYVILCSSLLGHQFPSQDIGSFDIMQLEEILLHEIVGGRKKDVEVSVRNDWRGE